MKNNRGPACRPASQKRQRGEQAGYTLIELVVVTGIMVTISGILAGIFYSTLRGVDTTNSGTAITQNGNYALSIMSQTIKQATRVTSVTEEDGTVTDIDDCTASPVGQTMTFEMRDGSVVEYSCDFTDGYIASNSSSLIDKNAVKLIGSSSTCSFTCIQDNTFAVPRVQMQFQLGDKNGKDDNLNASFQTQVNIRNY